MSEAPQSIRETPAGALLDAFLNQLRLRAAFIVLGQMGTGLEAALPAEGTPALHYLPQGRCTVRIGEDLWRLRGGDVLFMPRGRARRVRVEPTPGPLPPTPFAQLVPRVPPGSVVRFAAGAPPRIDVLGLAACVESPSQALELLPPVSVFPASAGFRVHLEALMTQAESHQPGAFALATRLAEVVFVHALRDLALALPEGAALAAAARDPHLARALLAVQRDLTAPWTVPRLARTAGMSRSAFAALFLQTLGTPPMQFIRRWRMSLATRQLRAGARVQQVADALGYASAAAFSTAYKRVTGRPPSQAAAGVSAST